MDNSTLDCRHCGEYLQGDANAIGARCPRCREPLYERSDAVRRQREAQESRGDMCPVHPGNVAVGPCKRCGTFMCGLCRTRWDDRVLCLACVERLLANKESDSEQLQAHRWQATASVLLGIASWVLSLLALPLGSPQNSTMPKEMLGVLLVLALVSLIPSLFGLGQAAAAIRVRGDRMVLATCGLLLSGAQIGTVTGLMLLMLWKQ